MYRTLLEKAKPELKKAIAVYKVDYPSSGGLVEKALEQAIGISFLEFGIVINLGSILRYSGLSLDLNNPWEWFEDK
jgi:hypothetical protein